MSKLSAYVEAKKDHKDMVNIIERSGKHGNSRHLHTVKLNDIYHEVGFSFNSKDCNRHRYEKSERLAKYIGEACEDLMDAILKMAIVKSDQDIASRAIDARDEAEAVLSALDEK